MMESTKNDISKSLVVLLVEDDFDLAETIIQYLEIDGIECDHSFNGQNGLELILENNYDVLLLDIMLPALDGLQICEAARKAGIDTPVLILTARDTLNDKLAGFDAGTDDYLVKPFDMEELVARIRALSQRRSGQMRLLTVGELVMDIDRRTVARSGHILNLRPTGWIILEILMRAYPQVVGKRQLEQKLWPDEIPDSNSLKVHMHHLRQQVDKPFKKPVIATIPNQGFTIHADSKAKT